MKDKKAQVKPYAMSQYYRNLSAAEAKKSGYAERKLWGYAMRTNRYRFVMWMNNFTSTQPFSAGKVYATELYDMEKDPLEKVNVSKDARYAKDEKILQYMMIEYFKSQETGPRPSRP
jgi:hypothetical protein